MFTLKRTEQGFAPHNKRSPSLWRRPWRGGGVKRGRLKTPQKSITYRTIVNL